MPNVDIEGLRAVLPQLSANSATFAQSLIQAFERYGSLTERQAPWVAKLIAKANAANEPQAPRPVVGDFAPIMELFARASQRLRKPKICLLIEDIGEVKLSIAGERARVPGSLNVADNAPYGQGRWYGRVMTDGTFACSNTDTPPNLLPCLREFAANPAEVAGRHGRLMGRCCFCAKGLDDPRSTAVGYGPVCAKNYGLPWGSPELFEAVDAVASRARG